MVGWAKSSAATVAAATARKNSLNSESVSSEADPPSPQVSHTNSLPHLPPFCRFLCLLIIFLWLFFSPLSTNNNLFIPYFVFCFRYSSFRLLVHPFAWHLGTGGLDQTYLVHQTGFVFESKVLRLSLTLCRAALTSLFLFSIKIRSTMSFTLIAKNHR